MMANANVFAALMNESLFTAARAAFTALLAFAMLALGLLTLARKNGGRVRKAFSESLTTLGVLAALASVVLTLPQTQAYLVGSTAETENAVVDASTELSSVVGETVASVEASNTAPESADVEGEDKDDVEPPALTAAAADAGDLRNESRSESRNESKLADDSARILQSSYLRRNDSASRAATAAVDLYELAAETAEDSYVDNAVALGLDETRRYAASDSSTRYTPNRTDAFKSTVDATYEKVSAEAKNRVCMVAASDRSNLRTPTARKKGTLSPYPGSRAKLYVTAYHVVADAKSLSEIQAILPNGDAYTPIRGYKDPIVDVAVFEFDEELVDFCPALRDVGEEPIHAGETCFGVGCRLGMIGNLFDSKVGSVRDRDELEDLFYYEASLNPALRLFQLNEPVAEGDSGGALFDAFDRFFGIMKAKSREGGYVFVIPADVVAKVVADAERSWYGPAETTF